MIRARTHTVLFLTCFSLLFATLASGQTKAELWKRLEKGEVIVTSKKVKGSSTPRIKAVGLIKAPPAKVWKIIDKCDDYERTMQRIKKADEISRKGNVVRCKITLKMPFPLKNVTALTEAVHTVEEGKKYRRAWKLIEGDFKRNKGSWTLTAHAGGKHTIAVYRLLVEPKVPVPAMIQQMAQRKTLPELYQHLRKQLE